MFNQLRGRYQQIIDQDRGRLTDAFENDDADYIAVANTLCIIHSTSRSIYCCQLLAYW